MTLIKGGVTIMVDKEDKEGKKIEEEEIKKMMDEMSKVSKNGSVIHEVAMFGFVDPANKL